MKQHNRCALDFTPPQKTERNDNHIGVRREKATYKQLVCSQMPWKAKARGNGSH